MYLAIYMLYMMIMPWFEPTDTAPLERLEAYCVSQGAIPLFAQNVCQDANDSARTFPMPAPQGF